MFKNLYFSSLSVFKLYLSCDLLIIEIYFYFQNVQSSIDPSVNIGSYSEIARDVAIKAGSYVGSYSNIGAGSGIDQNTKIGDYSNIGDGSRIGQGTIIESYVTLRKNKNTESTN